MSVMTDRPWDALRAAAQTWPYRGVHYDKGFRWEPWNDEMIAVVVDSLADKGLIVAAVNDYDRLRAIEAAARLAVEAFDNSHLPHDVAYEDVAETLFALRSLVVKP